MTKKEVPNRRNGVARLRGEGLAEALSALERLEARLSELEERIARDIATDAERTTARALAWRIEAQRERIFAPERKHAYHVSIRITQ